MVERGEGAAQRQALPDLHMALAEAVRMFRATAREYRDPRNNHNLDKNVRKGLAATYDDWALAVERHASTINSTPSHG